MLSVRKQQVHVLTAKGAKNAKLRICFSSLAHFAILAVSSLNKKESLLESVHSCTRQALTTCCQVKSLLSICTRKGSEGESFVALAIFFGAVMRVKRTLAQSLRGIVFSP